jgi:predicted DsbA family dithiol-disulfide isomerase
MSIEIDVISDVVCPWCFIGKRHLERALDLYRKAHPGEPGPVVNWHPFELNPQLPREGVARKEYVEQKFGGAERAVAVYARVTAAGQGAGIDFAFDRIARQPNTRDAHRLILYAQRHAKQQAVVEALFEHFFLRHTDLTLTDNLALIAQEAGLDREDTLAYLASDKDSAEIEALERRAHTIGVQGVPFFIFNRRYAVSGAQPPEALLQAMNESISPSPS